MAAIYARLVQKGLRTLEQVPASLRDDVRRILGVSEDPEPEPAE